MMYEYRCSLVNVVDGDTVDVSVDMGFRVYQTMRMRLYGIDTPEKGQEGWVEATEYVKGWFSTAMDPVVETQKDKKDSFGRYLGTFYADNNYDNCLNDNLINNGLAKVYTK